MARRILIGECKHETNSFAANHTNLSDFNARYYKNAGEMISFFRGVGCEVGGFIDVCEAASAVIIPSVAANAMPGGGAAGDATHVLKALLTAGANNVALAVIVDPETVEQAARAGIGARIQVKLGGKSEPVSGTPVETEAVVKSLTDGNFRNKGPVHRGLAVTSGLTAVLGIDGIDVVVCSTRLQPQDPEIFRRNGIDPMDKNILVVKSAQHYRAAYEEIASEIIEVDAPGLASQHPKHFPFTRIGRPAFPLDEI